MKTNKEDRKRWRQFYQFNPDDILPATTQRILDLIDDVEEATAHLRQQHEALAPNKRLPHMLCGICDFLKEPSG